MGVTVFVSFTATGISRDELEALGDGLMEELLKLEDAGCGIHSSTVALDLGTQHVEIEVSLDEEDEKAALAVGQSCIRAAIHATGGNTAALGREVQTALLV